MKFVYTLISYQKNYRRYYGGGEYDIGENSDFELEIFYTREALISSYKDRLISNQYYIDTKQRYEPWECRLLLNGIDIFSYDIEEFLDEDELNNFKIEEQLLKTEAIEIELNLKEKTKQKEITKKNAEEAEKLRLEKVALEAKEKFERAELVRLKAKYENIGDEN